jgi:hypothetical protein
MTLLASSYDQSRFLKADDLTAEKKFRIKNVTKELVGMDKEKEPKLVVWFSNDKRGLVLNKTNNRTIRKAFGDPVEGWSNKIIAIFPSLAEYRGTMKPALRVRIPEPKPPKQAALVVATQPSSSGSGASTKPEVAASPTKAAPPVDDPELEADPVTSLRDEMDDEIEF